jgi:xylulokinase
VYWKKGAERVLHSLKPNQSLTLQLKNTGFSVEHSPIWMDNSTTEYCVTLEKMLGGPSVLANWTGSRGYERFTIHQIQKVIFLNDSSLSFCQHSISLSHF